MEYNPNIFSSYEVPSGGATPSNVNDKELKQYGKFERNIVKTGYTEKHGALSIFLVASVLETKQKQLLKEATGLDDVVKVSLSLSLSCAGAGAHSCLLIFVSSFISYWSPDLR